MQLDEMQLDPTQFDVMQLAPTQVISEQQKNIMLLSRTSVMTALFGISYTGLCILLGRLYDSEACWTYIAGENMNNSARTEKRSVHPMWCDSIAHFSRLQKMSDD